MFYQYIYTQGVPAENVSLAAERTNNLSFKAKN